MEFNNSDITKGYQTIPKTDLFNLPSGKDDCQLCEGSGDVQCCRGEYYYTDTCDCVLIQYWEDKGNKHMASGYKKMYEKTLYYRNI